MSRAAIVIGWRIHPPWIDGTSVLARSVVNGLIELSEAMAFYPCLISTYWIPEHRRLSILNDELHRYKQSYLSKLASFEFLREPLPNPAPLMISALFRIIKRFRLERIYIHLFDQVLLNEAQLVLLLRKFSLLSKRKIRIIDHVRTLTQLETTRWNIIINKCIDVYALTSLTFKNIFKAISPNDKERPMFLVIPPSINTRIFSSYPKEKACEIITQRLNLDLCSNSDYTMLHMASVSEDRFPAHFILKSLAKLKHQGINVSLIVASRDPIKNLKRLKTIINASKKYGLEENIILLKRYLTEPEKVMLLNAVDVLLQLYSSRLTHDVIVPPLTLLEAMACGTPIISTKTLYTVDVVKDRLLDNLALKSLDVNEFSFKLESILTDNSFRKKIARIERKIVEDYFSISKLKEAIKRLYNELE